MTGLRGLLPLFAGLAASAVILAAPPAVAGSAAAGSGPQAAVTSVRLSTSRIVVSGVATAPLTVEVGFRQESTAQFPPEPSRVVLYPAELRDPLPPPARLGATARLISVVMMRVTGTATDGTWRGTVPIPSSLNGRWRVGCVMLPVVPPGHGGICLTPSAAQRPTLVVVGTHRPRLTMQISPTRVPPPYTGNTDLRVSGRVVDSATGRPFRTARPLDVTVSFGAMCVVEGDCSHDAGLSGAYVAADGRFTTAVDTDQLSPVCVTLPVAGTHPTDNQAPTYARACRDVTYTLRLRATSAPRTVRLEQQITVTGRLLPAPKGLNTSAATGAVVQLQRLDSGVWRSIGRATTRPDGSVIVRAPAAARQGTASTRFYRLVLNGTHRVTRATSTVFVVTVIR